MLQLRVYLNYSCQLNKKKKTFQHIANALHIVFYWLTGTTHHRLEKSTKNC